MHGLQLAAPLYLKAPPIDLGSREAADYICESACYALHRADRTGEIEAAIFVHVPANLTAGQRRLFVNTFLDALFDKSGAPISGRLAP